MKKLKNILATFLQTKWFIFASWKYIVDDSMKSKIQLFIGFVPAYFRFMNYTYKDISLLSLETFNLCNSNEKEYSKYF